MWLAPPADEPEAAYARSQLLEELEAALAALPAAQREVFVAHEFEEQSFKDLAAESGEPINTLMGLLAIGVFGAIVMLLWNGLVPALTGWQALRFVQALGLPALCRILFGGIGRGEFFRERMRTRFERMRPEERERFRARFGGRCPMGEEPQPTAEG